MCEGDFQVDSFEIICRCVIVEDHFFFENWVADLRLVYFKSVNGMFQSAVTVLSGLKWIWI